MRQGVFVIIDVTPNMLRRIANKLERMWTGTRIGEETPCHLFHEPGIILKLELAHEKLKLGEKGENQIMEEALEILSGLGNGGRPGNSDGNIIAQDALRSVKKLREGA